MARDLTFRFSGEIWHWRGPSPFHFVTVPDDESAELKELSPSLTYGWGVIGVWATIGDTEYTTSLFPKDEGYALPIKSAVRRAEALEIGSVVDVIMEPTRSL